MKNAYYPTAILLIIVTFIELGLAGYADYQLQVNHIQAGNGLTLLIGMLGVILLVGLLFLTYLYRREQRNHEGEK